MTSETNSSSETHEPLATIQVESAPQSSVAIEATPTKISAEINPVTNPNPNNASPIAVSKIAQTPGEILRAARLQLGLKPNEIATRLRMSTSQIDALEENHFAKLPTGTFLRGFVRNYAKVVNVDSALAIAALERAHVAAAATAKNQPPITAFSQNIKFSSTTNHYQSNRVRIGLAMTLLFALLVAIYYWWLFIRQQPVSTEIAIETSSEVQKITADIPQSISAAPPLDENIAAPIPVARAPEVPMMPRQTTVSVAPVTPQQNLANTAPINDLKAISDLQAQKKLDRKLVRTGNSGILGLSFSGDSWVEIKDADNNIVVSKFFKAGDVEEFTGRQPLNILIGNAKVTRMAHNGKEFDLAPHTKLAVAHVTIP